MQRSEINILSRIVRLVGLICNRLYRDARSAKHKYHYFSLLLLKLNVKLLEKTQINLNIT